MSKGKPDYQSYLEREQLKRELTDAYEKTLLESTAIDFREMASAREELAENFSEEEIFISVVKNIIRSPTLPIQDKMDLLIKFIPDLDELISILREELKRNVSKQDEYGQMAKLLKSLYSKNLK